MFRSACRAYTYICPPPTIRPRSSVAVVPETATMSPALTSREYPKIGSHGVLVEIREITLIVISLPAGVAGRGRFYCSAIANRVRLFEFPRHRAHRRADHPPRRHQPVDDSRDRRHGHDRTLLAAHHVEFMLDDFGIMSICEPYARENIAPIVHPNTSTATAPGAPTNYDRMIQMLAD